MPNIDACAIPAESLLQRYAGPGGYADCYRTQIAGPVSQAAYITAFYTSPLFKLERKLLHWFARRPASDADATRLGAGEVQRFSAWTVEQQYTDQLLLADFTGRTRSWLMTQVVGDTTELYFGSAVIPRIRKDGRAELGFLFRSLLGFHRLYSRLLLKAARRRLATP